MPDDTHITYATYAKYSYCTVCRVNSNNSQIREIFEQHVAFQSEHKQTVSAYCIHLRRLWFTDSATQTVKQHLNIVNCCPSWCEGYRQTGPKSFCVAVKIGFKSVGTRTLRTACTVLQTIPCYSTKCHVTWRLSWCVVS